MLANPHALVRVRMRVDVVLCRDDSGDLRFVAYLVPSAIRPRGQSLPSVTLVGLLPTLAPELAATGELETMVQSGVDRALSMQTPAGGFAYWPGGSEPAYWATAYATHMLLDAQKLGYNVPQSSLDAALEWMERQVTNLYEAGRQTDDDWYSKDAEPYFHFVLAMAGKGRKARVERLIGEIGLTPTEGDKKEALYMLQAALYMAGDQRYEAALKHPDVSLVTNERHNWWSFYSDCRRRGFMLSTMIDLFGRDPSAEPLVNLVAESLRGHESHWYTTQELVWGVTGLGKWSEEGAKEFAPPDTLPVDLWPGAPMDVCDGVKMDC